MMKTSIDSLFNDLNRAAVELFVKLVINFESHQTFAFVFSVPRVRGHARIFSYFLLTVISLEWV